MTRSEERGDERFVILERVGAGGMGQVFRAVDRVTGNEVALKLVRGSRADVLSRFAREAETLAQLRIPGVVKYVGHGFSENGEPYLAMEWLTGETLSARLSRTNLTIAESVTLASRVAATLGAVHRLGLVHRDIKPSNLLLVDDAVDKVTLIDFGVVRGSVVSPPLTRTGAVVGTPGYMAPEQARGEAQIDARADVFSLGCVLYRCLAGRAAFEGNGLALLAKVLLEHPPSVRHQRPAIPARLDALVMRMLAKAPGDRPRDGVAAASELASIELPPEASATGADVFVSLAAPSVGLTEVERRLICMVFCARDDTLDGATEPQTRAELEALCARFGAEVEMLDGTSPMFILSGAAAATDLAERAARCALALRTQSGGLPVVLVSGRAELRSRAPVAELIDRATQLLPPNGGGQRWQPVRIDEVTARLVRGRFAVTETDGGAFLDAPANEHDTRSELLGKPIPCVGRERELATLSSELSHCIEESVASAMLVVGVPGLGKSRIRREFIRRIEEEGKPLAIWFGKGDAMGAGATFGPLVRALSSAMGLREGEPLEARRRKVVAHLEPLARHGLDVPHVAAFLGELLGVRFPDDAAGRLRAARRNPILMSDQIRSAWEDLIRAQCTERPLVLVLEDLQWGDQSTMDLVSAALHHARKQPFFVLGLGRPEIHALFPKLWAGLPVQTLHLARLPRRAAERLVHHAFGGAVDAELVEQVVAKADGNPFYLEELIRAAAAGEAGNLPETVMAMVQTRLEGLGDGARRAMRAASILGETFWHGGLAALLPGANIGAWLDELTAREVIVRQRAGRLAGEIEYRFRHALLREAAYGMLTAADTRLGHALAGDWLEAAGLADPVALIEHFERGELPARAALACLDAAEQALRGNDLASAVARAERGLRCEPGPAIIGALRSVQAEAHLWRGELSPAEECATLAMEHLARGSAAWFEAATRLALAISKRGASERLEACVEEVAGVTAEPSAQLARSTFFAECATDLIFGGRYALADLLIEELDRTPRDLAAPEVVARLEQARAIRITPANDPDACLARFEASLAAFEQAGDRRNACMARMNVGYCCAEFGDFATAEAYLRSALADAERLALHGVTAYCLLNLGLALAFRGAVAEGEAAELSAIEAAERMGDPRLLGVGRCYLAQIKILAGDAESAEREARAALDVLGIAPSFHVFTLAVRARALVQLGRVDEALTDARAAAAALESAGTLEEGESVVRLALVEALAAAGFTAEADQSLLRAQESLLARAAKINSPARRARFLEAIPHHALLLERARSAGALSPSVRA